MLKRVFRFKVLGLFWQLPDLKVNLITQIGVDFLQIAMESGMYDNFCQKTIILRLSYDNLTSWTWQHWSLPGRYLFMCGKLVEVSFIKLDIYCNWFPIFV